MLSSTPTTTLLRARCVICGEPSTHARRTAVDTLVQSCPDHQRDLEKYVALANGWRSK
jgi:hypothetical protein